MAKDGRGPLRPFFWEWGSVWLGQTSLVTDAHAHHALQLTVSIYGKAQLRVAGGDWQAFEAVLVPSQLEHRFQAPGALVANIFCEPQSAMGRRLGGLIGGGDLTPVVVPKVAVAGLLAAYTNGAEEGALVAASQAVLAAVAGGPLEGGAIDGRIKAALDFMQSHLDEPIGLVRVAAAVGLSEGRLRHLFASETGIGFRGYLLWARLNRALDMGFSGVSWTEAAHAANFADAAHLTRTCHKTFGFAPTQSLRRLAVVTDSWGGKRELAEE